MYIKYLTDLEIETFIKTFVKQDNIENYECGEDAVVEVLRIKRTESAVTITTQIKDETGYKNQSWVLANFAAMYIKNGFAKEDVYMTKLWSKYIYEVLKTHGKDGQTIANAFKRNYIERIEAQMEGKIFEAKRTFQELVF